jgi:hypothetical protein
MSSKQVILSSRINYAEVIMLKDGEGLRISPYAKTKPLDAELVPDVLPRGITSQPLGDN